MAQEGWPLEQEEAPCTTPAPGPSLCSNNCGFFGSATTMNLCSSCYKSLRAPALPLPLDSAFSPSSSTCSTTAPADVAVAVATAPAVVDISVCRVKGQPLRCSSCLKKVGLRGFKCRCGDLFCAFHRYFDKHSCSFDYKSAGRTSIEKANPVVKAEKLDRI